jgi:hypothetical protein
LETQKLWRRIRFGTTILNMFNHLKTKEDSLLLNLLISLLITICLKCLTHSYPKVKRDFMMDKMIKKKKIRIRMNLRMERIIARDRDFIDLT